jgi:hypothetical protein
MQTMHLPLIPPPILTNHTPPTSSFNLPLAFWVNVGPQPYIFPNPLHHGHVRPFPLSILQTPPVAQDRTPQPTFISSTHLQPPPKVSCPIYWRQFTNQRLICH